MRLLYMLLAIVALSGSASAAEIRSSVAPTDLSKDKSTTLGLYLSPGDVASALRVGPSILFIDVRDPIEIYFVGHPVSIDADLSPFSHPVIGRALG